MRYSSIAGLGLTCILFACGSTPPADITDPGQLIFLGYSNKEVNCARCHGQNGEGTDEGPDIRQSFRKFDEAALSTIILNGKGLGPDAMPPFADKLEPKSIEQVVVFLKTMLGTGPVVDD